MALKVNLNENPHKTFDRIIDVMQTKKLKNSPKSLYRRKEEFIRYALDSAAIVAITDVKGTITFVNSKFCQISGYSNDELIGSNHRMLKSGVHDVAFFKDVYRQIAQGRIWHGEICNKRKNGSLYWVDTTIVPHVSAAGKVDSYTAIRFDITPRKLIEEELRTSKERLDVLANVDPLTGLANRRRFQEFMESRLAEGVSSTLRFHLALMDIDSFKEVNDTLGHDVGDILLQTMASRLRAKIADNGFIARLGGDEFGLVLTETADSDIPTLLNEVLESARAPISVGDSLRRGSTSIGISTFPDHGEDAATLFKAADIALYHAKSLGRDRAEFFNDKLKKTIELRSTLLADIDSGLIENQFELFYQPIVPTDSSGKISFEALIRWQHPKCGMVSPSFFHAGFEDQPTAAALGMFVLKRVFSDAHKLQELGIEPNRIAINVTNADFRSELFVDSFFRLARETGIPPQQFCVEVTEGMFLGRDQQRVYQGLRRLHGAGVEVAFDDFGTGFASLTHLRQMPIDRLKIDRSFITNIHTSTDDQAIVEGIIQISHRMGKHVVAEGVETQAQMDVLLSMGCDFIQGWLLGKACSINELPDMIRQMPKRINRAIRSAFL